MLIVFDSSDSTWKNAMRDRDELDGGSKNFDILSQMMDEWCSYALFLLYFYKVTKRPLTYTYIRLVCTSKKREIEYETWTYSKRIKESAVIWYESGEKCF